MNIGIIGSGNMGGGLGKLWAEAGHRIMFSYSRSPRKLEELAGRAGANAQAGSPEEAARFGDVVALTVPWGQVEDALRSAGSLDGKILLSTVNALNRDLSGLEIGHTTSAAEEVAKLAPGAEVFEAFTSVFAPLLSAESRIFSGKKASVFYCGDGAAARKAVDGLIEDAGFEPVDAGPLVSARYVEPFGMLMIQLAYGMGRGANIAVALLERPET